MSKKIRRNIEDTQRTQIILLGISTKMYEMKIYTEYINGKTEIAEGKTNELEDTATETTQNKTQKGKNSKN